MQPENTVEASIAKQTPVGRGGCLSAWLVFVILVNSIVGLLYSLGPDSLLRNVPNFTHWEFRLLGLAGLANVVFAVLIWNWRRLGFWGILATTLLSFVINLSAHLGALAFVGLISPLILALLVWPHWSRLK